MTFSARVLSALEIAGPVIILFQLIYPNMFPVRKIVLFKHGVGYFERQKRLTSDDKVDLFFRAEEMNDALKSFTALEVGENGGSISSISYQAQTPVEKELEQLSLRLERGDYSLTELLQQV